MALHIYKFWAYNAALDQDDASLQGGRGEVRQHGVRREVGARAGMRWRRGAAFSLVEVMMAGMVFMLAIIGSLGVVKHGLLALDSARRLPVASQVMQSELERLRLSDWGLLSGLAEKEELDLRRSRAPEGMRLKCVREVRTVKDGLLEVTLTATWGGVDGRDQIARMRTQFSRTGSHDHYYIVP